MATSAPTSPGGKRQMTIEWQPFNLVNNWTRWFTFSSGLIVIGFIFMGLNIQKFGSPFRLGIDFTGGTLYSQTYDSTAAQKLDAAKISNIVEGIDNKAPTVQISEGNNGERTLLIRASSALAGEAGRAKLAQLDDALKQEYGDPLPATKNISEVSPTISGELVQSAIYGLLVGNLLVFAWIWARMRADFGLFGIIALVHDLLITFGFMAMMSYVAAWEINSWFVAVILTILGYSITDTIVIYDRIRENLHIYPRADFPHLVNFSLIQTLTRSVYTVMTVVIVLVAMLIGQEISHGASGLKEFNAVMLCGMISGAYSSIFVASQLLVAWYRYREAKHGVGFQHKPGDEDEFQSPTIAQIHKVGEKPTRLEREMEKEGMKPVEPEGDSASDAARPSISRTRRKGSDILGTPKPRPNGTAAGSDGESAVKPAAPRPKSKKRW